LVPDANGATTETADTGRKAEVKIGAGFSHGCRFEESGADDRIGGMHSEGELHADIPAPGADDLLAGSRGGDVPIQLYRRQRAPRSAYDSHLVHRVGSRVYLEGDPPAWARVTLERAEKRGNDAPNRRAEVEGDVVPGQLDAVDLALLHEYVDGFKAAHHQVHVNEQHVRAV
jgi:hypothetical protein